MMVKRTSKERQDEEGNHIQFGDGRSVSAGGSLPEWLHTMLQILDPEIE